MTKRELYADKRQLAEKHAPVLRKLAATERRYNDKARSEKRKDFAVGVVAFIAGILIILFGLAGCEQYPAGSPYRVYDPEGRNLTPGEPGYDEEIMRRKHERR